MYARPLLLIRIEQIMICVSNLFSKIKKELYVLCLCVPPLESLLSSRATNKSQDEIRDEKN